MKLDPELIHYLTKEHFRILTAVEMGMRNHEFVPVPLIESLAALKRSNTYKLLQLLLKHKLVMHTNKQYDGYALTYQGYDYLALKTFLKRKIIATIGLQIGIGKESDIYMCQDENQNTVVIKLARLGRTSFRTVKDKRDYVKNKTSYSWLYLSRIASLKEFAFMKVLYDRKFPTPVPIDANRHAIAMSYIEGYPLCQVKEMGNPEKVYETLLNLIIRLAENGLVHGDFNEFNLLIDDDENVTMIDFPQMTSTDHINAQMYFARDVKCVQDFFNKKFGLKFDVIPILETDIERKEDLDKEVKASGWVKEALGDNTQAFDLVDQCYHQSNNQENSDNEDADEQKSNQSEEQEDEQKGDEDDCDSEDNKEQIDKEQDEQKEGEDSNKQEEKKHKRVKLTVNNEYVKEKVKKQFNTRENKQRSKRNRNKDKKVMKETENIKDFFRD